MHQAALRERVRRAGWRCHRRSRRCPAWPSPARGRSGAGASGPPGWCGGASPGRSKLGDTRAAVPLQHANDAGLLRFGRPIPEAAGRLSEPACAGFFTSARLRLFAALPAALTFVLDLLFPISLSSRCGASGRRHCLDPAIGTQPAGRRRPGAGLSRAVFAALNRVRRAVPPA